MESSQWENLNDLFCRKVSFLTGPHCQFRGIGQGMKKTLLRLSVDTTKYTLNKLDYNCLYNNTPCKVIVKVASILFVWLILFISYNDFVQYKGEQIGQTILPDINLSRHSVADPGIFF